jgi:putative ABC transport system permease protein
MNLAYRDIRHNFGRFLLTALGIGLLLMTVLGMTGIYRGLIEDATNLVDRVGADLWVVQKNTRGPFAEISRVPRALEDRLAVVPGVARARAFLSHTIQRERDGHPIRMVIQGLSWPHDSGEWMTLVEGRPLGAAHFELIADELLNLEIGETLLLGKNTYTVVGIARGMVGQGGDGMAFFTLSDAMAIQNDRPGEAIRLERAGRLNRAESIDLSHTQPTLLHRAEGPASAIPALGGISVSAILLDLRPGADPDRVRSIVAGWADVDVFTSDQQRALLLEGSVDKARRQIGLFRALLVAISAIIMALILYTLTLDKIHDIAMLKLLGARSTVILGMILQQALLLGFLGYGIAWYLGGFLFPKFPRRVIILDADLIALAAVVAAISVASSLLGIWKAMKVNPNDILS